MLVPHDLPRPIPPHPCREFLNRREVSRSDGMPLCSMRYLVFLAVLAHFPLSQVWYSNRRSHQYVIWARNFMLNFMNHWDLGLFISLQQISKLFLHHASNTGLSAILQTCWSTYCPCCLRNSLFSSTRGLLFLSFIFLSNYSFPIDKFTDYQDQKIYLLLLSNLLYYFLMTFDAPWNFIMYAFVNLLVYHLLQTGAPWQV